MIVIVVARWCWFWCCGGGIGSNGANMVIVSDIGGDDGADGGNGTDGNSSGDGDIGLFVLALNFSLR